MLVSAVVRSLGVDLHPAVVLDRQHVNDLGCCFRLASDVSPLSGGRNKDLPDVAAIDVGPGLLFHVCLPCGILGFALSAGMVFRPALTFGPTKATGVAPEEGRFIAECDSFQVLLNVTTAMPCQPVDLADRLVARAPRCLELVIDPERLTELFPSQHDQRTCAAERFHADEEVRISYECRGDRRSGRAGPPRRPHRAHTSGRSARPLSSGGPATSCDQQRLRRSGLGASLRRWWPA